MSDNSTLSKDLLRITRVKKQTKCLGRKSYKFQPHPWQGNLSYVKTCFKMNSPACFCASGLRINQGPAWKHKEHLSIAGVTTGLALVHREAMQVGSQLHRITVGLTQLTVLPELLFLVSSLSREYPAWSAFCSLGAGRESLIVQNIDRVCYGQG